MKRMVLVLAVATMLVGCGSNATAPISTVVPTATIDAAAAKLALERRVASFFRGTSPEKGAADLASRHFPSDLLPHEISFRSMESGTTSDEVHYVDITLNASSIDVSDQATYAGATFSEGGDWTASLRSSIYGTSTAARAAFNESVAGDLVYQFYGVSEGPFEVAARYVPSAASRGRVENDSVAYLVVDRVIVSSNVFFSPIGNGTPNIQPGDLAVDIAIAGAGFLEQLTHEAGTPAAHSGTRAERSDELLGRFADAGPATHWFRKWLPHVV